jgi:zinc/manganese transport system ATP-binding protein
MAHGHSAVGTPEEVVTSATLSKLYGTSVEVIRSGDHVFVVGAEI